MRILTDISFVYSTEVEGIYLITSGVPDEPKVGEFFFMVFVFVYMCFILLRLSHGLFVLPSRKLFVVL
mgnify:CR=1 FL=1